MLFLRVFRPKCILLFYNDRELCGDSIGVEDLTGVNAAVHLLLPNLVTHSTSASV